MKMIIVLLAIVAVAAGAPGYESQHDPWNQWNAWNSNPWKSSGGGWNPWQQPSHHHEAHVVHAIQVQQPHPIPPLHPKPLTLKAHDHPTRIHYENVHPGHPHLIGHEVYHEPQIEVKPVHGHGW